MSAAAFLRSSSGSWAISSRMDANWERVASKAAASSSCFLRSSSSGIVGEVEAAGGEVEVGGEVEGEVGGEVEVGGEGRGRGRMRGGAGRMGLGWREMEGHMWAWKASAMRRTPLAPPPNNPTSPLADPLTLADPLADPLTDPLTDPLEEEEGVGGGVMRGTWINSRRLATAHSEAASAIIDSAVS